MKVPVLHRSTDWTSRGLSKNGVEKYGLRENCISALTAIAFWGINVL